MTRRRHDDDTRKTTRTQVQPQTPTINGNPSLRIREKETLILCHQLCLGTMASLLCPGKMVHKWPKVTSRTKHNPRGRVRYCSPSRALPPVKREGIPSQNRVLQNDNPQQYHPIYTLSFKKKKEYIRANVSSV